MNETFIIVKWDLEGIHNWSDAPEEYAVLRNKHSHIFHFEVQILVTASRQVEFLAARRRLVKAVIDRYGPEPCDFGSMSCEDLANVLVSLGRDLYNCGTVVRVFEDVFVGSEVRRLDG